MEVIVFSVVIGILAALAFSAKRQYDINARGGCPECGTPVPRFRRPTSWRQSLWGGWTCAECGTEMDQYGRELAQR